eukprot:12538632-Prorocentrum_lima.AAC.1
MPADGKPLDNGLGGVSPVDPVLDHAPAVRLPLPVAGRRGSPPCLRGHRLRRVPAHAALYVWRGVRPWRARHQAL